MNKTSWKTTTGGIIAAVMAILSIGMKVVNGEGISSEETMALIAALSAAFGLLSARDNNVTSEEVGAK